MLRDFLGLVVVWCLGKAEVAVMDAVVQVRPLGMNHHVGDAPAVFGFGQEIKIATQIEIRRVRDFFVAGWEDFHLGSVSGDHGRFDVWGGDVFYPDCR